MKHTKTAKTTLDPDLAKRALAADMGNALRAVNNGQLLPKYRREQLEAIAAGRPSPSSTTFAANYAGLAAALGCTRQRLAYWTRQPDAPKPREDGRHDVGAWRAYLAARGRLPSAAGTPQPDADDRRPRVRMDWGDACDAAIDAVGDALPRALAASGISATDKAVLGLWLVLAAAIDARATAWGFPSYFQPDQSSYFRGTLYNRRKKAAHCGENQHTRGESQTATHLDTASEIAKEHLHHPVTHCRKREAPQQPDAGSSQPVTGQAV